MLVRVALPELGSYLAKLGVIAVFLGAYGIPVTFHNVATVAASNSISNSVSVTPGGVGVNQAMNTAALRNETSKSNATAYSAAQQLITTAWNVVFAMIIVSWVFGWTGGQAAGRVLLRRCEGTQPGDERGTQEAKAREAAGRRPEGP